MSSFWGDQPTTFFYSLTPDAALTALEQCGFVPTGLCIPLASYENRVYEMEFENPDGTRSRKVAKFYRPGRWSSDQILDEHDFLKDLVDGDVPVIAPEVLMDDATLAQTDAGIYYALFPKKGGRAPEDLSAEDLMRVGRNIGRLHGVGRQFLAEHRLKLNAEVFGRGALQIIYESGRVPEEIRERLKAVSLRLIEEADVRLKGQPFQRIHGDCHAGNILWRPDGLLFVDFDDMAMGPPVQDLWLLLRDDEDWKALVEGYTEFSPLPEGSKAAIPSLRALRLMHYAAWLTKRYEDPAFQKAFPQFDHPKYWFDLLNDLEAI